METIPNIAEVIKHERIKSLISLRKTFLETSNTMRQIAIKYMNTVKQLSDDYNKLADDYEKEVKDVDREIKSLVSCEADSSLIRWS